ncbi:hypothetical protein HHI36_004787 [Cryptolaemus montrouzieri]|uniref:Uncharacterized protein n=1 Tax=Cryptolaemus montrouzieri TaxID=559131 RepID=A0ABD2NSI0_9CUCU
MEKLLEDIRAKLEIIDKRNAIIEGKIHGMQKEMGNLKKENEERKLKNLECKIKIQEQESRIIMLEKEIRKKNIIIQGLDEEIGEDEEQPKTKIQKVMNDMEVKIYVVAEILNFTDWENLIKVGVR